mmetsp:Transcript_995/g.2343  ORF Transcript_995/g.2343 Transcript_995/m.2343 type:complete len:368 (+) Transcript_995:80-1183(+)
MAAREVAKAQCRKENQPLAPPMDASGRGEETRNIQSVLHSATAADIPTGDRAPIVISDDQPLVDALKFIADAWVRACPVRDTSTNTIIGTLDLRDIGQFMVQMHRSGASELEKGTGSRADTGSDRNVLMEFIASKNVPLEQLARKRPFTIVKPTTTLLELARTMSSGSHIVGISSEGRGDMPGGIGKVITQGMLFKYLVPHLQNLSVPVHDVMKAPIITVKCSSNALKCFEIMINKKISGLGVVDEDGLLIHNTSTSDIKMLITAPDLEDLSLNQSIEDFLVQLRSLQASHKTRVPVSSCNEDDEMKSAVAKLAKTGYHRVWVTNANKEPVGVMSLSDLFRNLVSERPFAKSHMSDAPFCHVTCSLM